MKTRGIFLSDLVWVGVLVFGLAARRPGTVLVGVTAAASSRARRRAERVRLGVEEPVETARQARPAADGADREQRAGDVRGRRLAGIVADVRRSPDAAKTTSVETMKLGRRSEWICEPATDAPRASRAPSTSSIGTRERRRADLCEPLGELASRPARRVRLAGARVVDHLPGVEMTRRIDRCLEQDGGRDREVARGDTPTPCSLAASSISA